MTLQPLGTHLAQQPASAGPAFIQLTIENGGQPLQLPLADSISLGRNSQVDWAKSIDLTPFGAQEKGVSFNHASLLKADGRILIVDQGSLNGTFINNYWIPPQLPFILNDGDCLHLGILQIKVNFSASKNEG